MDSSNRFHYLHGATSTLVFQCYLDDTSFPKLRYWGESLKAAGANSQLLDLATDIKSESSEDSVASSSIFPVCGYGFLGQPALQGRFKDSFFFTRHELK